ncbi:MAG: DUF3298 domain-containing protein [Lachnospiraceae bacterium]|nr:DUF3298 domain-containing protein [Lachnospiraceae bacterium]
MTNKKTIKRKQINRLVILLAALLFIGGCSRAAEGQQPESIQQEEMEMAEEDSLENNGENPADKDQDGLQTGESEEQEDTELLTRAPAPMILPTSWQDNRYSDDGELLAEGSLASFEVSGDGYETVAEAIQEWFHEEEAAFTWDMDLMEEYAKDWLIFALEEELPFVSYYSRVEYDVTRGDSSVISISRLSQDYSGGAHGLYGDFGTTFDTQTGERLSFWDLTDDREEFSEKTLDYCLKRVKEKHEDMLFADYETTIRTVWEGEPNWYLDGAGITIVFTPYELGPFAMGMVYITLPYQEFNDLLLEKYQIKDQAGVYVLPEGIETQVSLGEASGEKESICLFADSTDEEAYSLQTYIFKVGETAETVAEMDRLIRSYLLQREDGRSFLLFYGDMASEDYVTCVYELTGGGIRKIQDGGQGAFIQKGSISTQGFTLGIRVEALGTYTAYADYLLDGDGSLKPKGEWYPIRQAAVLTSIKELPVVVDGQKKMLSAGSRIQLIGTDGEGILRYQMMDSVENGEIHFTRGEDGWPIYVEGVEDTEYFEDLPYVG